MKVGIRAGKSYKDGYKQYKLMNKRQENKVKKLKRHIKRFPDDKQAVDNLARVERGGLPYRGKPNNPGLNKGTGNPEVWFGQTIVHPKLPGEQLAELLGIKIKQPRTYKKPYKTPIRYKKKKNVQS